MALTADALDAAVLRRCFWPSTNAPLTQAQRLAIADEEILGTLYPRVIAAHADYYQTTYDQAITLNQAQYRLPPNAYGPLKDVTVVDANNNEFSVALVDAEELGQGIWSQRYYGQFLGGGLSYSMFFAGDSLNLRPIPNQTQYTLRIRYYRRPSTLCLVANASKITGHSTTSSFDIINLDTDLTGVISATGPIDIVSSGNAHQLIFDNTAVTSLTNNGANILLSTGSSFPITLSVGDYVAVPGTTPLVQLPDFMQTACIRRVAAACLEAAKDASASDEYVEAERLIELAIETASPRVEGEPMMIMTNNSPFRTARLSRYGGRW